MITIVIKISLLAILVRLEYHINEEILIQWENCVISIQLFLLDNLVRGLLDICAI